jgi:hypothetical protein
MERFFQYKIFLFISGISTAMKDRLWEAESVSLSGMWQTLKKKTDDIGIQNIVETQKLRADQIWGMLATMQFRIFCLHICYIKTKD